MLGITLIAVLGSGSPEAQDVYRYTDEAGRPVFTDQPPAGREAERLALPMPAAGRTDPQRRLEDMTETATLLKEDRMAREARRDERRREAARAAEKTAAVEGAEDSAVAQPVISWIRYDPWAPGHGGWPGWHPGFRPPGHLPGWRPPHRSRLPPTAGGVLRPGPGTGGW